MVLSGKSKRLVVSRSNSSFIVLKVLPPTLNYVERGKGEKAEANARALRTSTTLQRRSLQSHFSL